MTMPPYELKPTRRAPTQARVEVTEGCVRLRALGLPRAEIARLMKVAKSSAGAWLLGTSRPTFEKTLGIQKIWGVDPRAWNHLPGWRG